eukprot:2383134-Pyramimonas_sp.AAC.1
MDWIFRSDIEYRISSSCRRGFVAHHQAGESPPVRRPGGVLRLWEDHGHRLRETQASPQALANHADVHAEGLVGGHEEGGPALEEGAQPRAVATREQLQPRGQVLRANALPR